MKLCGHDCVANCANCKSWAGGFVEEIAPCAEKGASTKDMAMCNAFDCRNRTTLTLVKEDQACS